MLETAKRYTGYSSYEYLEPGVDYEQFDLAPEIGRVAPYEGLELSDAQRDRVERILREEVVISLHDHPTIFPKDSMRTFDYNRTARQHTGYMGLARSGLTTVFDNLMDGIACVTGPAGWKWNDIVYDIGMRLSDIAHQDFVIKIESVKDIHFAQETGRVGLVVCLEASTPIENELDRIDVLYGLGVRQMGIAYSEANGLGSGLKEVRDGGLTSFGRKAVERMNKLGIAIDISHSGDVTCLDTIECSSQPIFITHAGARSLWNNNRLKPDDVITACAKRGGVIGIEAAPHTTLSPSHPRHSLDSVMDHFTYCVDLVGIEHVTFGPDTLFGDHVGLHQAFAGPLSIGESHGEGFERVPYVDGLENPAECFFNIVAWLVTRDYSEDEIRAVIGGNVLRVLDQVWY